MCVSCSTSQMCTASNISSFVGIVATSRGPWPPDAGPYASGPHHWLATVRGRHMSTSTSQIRLVGLSLVSLLAWLIL